MKIFTNWRQMTKSITFSCFCHQEYEGDCFYKYIKSTKDLLKTGTKTKCNILKNVYNSEECYHECQPIKKRCYDCKISNKDNNLEKPLYV